MTEAEPPAGAVEPPPWRAWQVGERVVVRYRLAVDGPGPRHSDALGELVAVGPEGLTVRTKGGDVVVPAAAIALGKRVPPPPPPRPARRADGRSSA
jgi:hypothetical protein